MKNTFVNQDKIVEGTTPLDAMSAHDFVEAYSMYCEKYSQSRTHNADAFRVKTFYNFLKDETFTFDGKTLKYKFEKEDAE